MLAVGNLFYLLGHCFKTQQRDSISFNLNQGGVDELGDGGLQFFFFGGDVFGFSAHLVLWDILQIGSVIIYLGICFLMDGVGDGGGQKAASLPPPSFPEHFCEFVGFDAQQLIQ